MRNPLAPNWLTGFTKDTYRSVCTIESDGVILQANGYNLPWLVNDSAEPWTAEALGGSPPGEGEHTANIVAIALDAGGSYLANNESATYYFTLRNDRIGIETAPQSLSITNSSGFARGVTATWSDTGLAVYWTHIVIYRRFKDASGFKEIAKVTVATGTYTDDTTWAALETKDAYLPRYRRSPPPYFKSIAECRQRIFGVTGKDNSLWHGQLPDIIGGEFVQVDFYREEKIGPGDSFGNCLAVVEHDGFLYIFKEEAIYMLEGDDPDNWTIRRTHAKRGCLTQRMIVPVREYFAFLDRDGLHLWTPGGDPVMAGADAGSNFSPLEPRWKSMNLAARELFDMAFHDDTGEIELLVATDGWPMPNRRIVYSTDEGCFTADEECYGTALGTLKDAGGDRHFCRGDELGFLWDQYLGLREGCTSGPTSGTMDSSTTALAWSIDTVTFIASISGVPGCPVERFSAAGVLIDTNRIYDGGLNSLTPLYWRPTAVASGQTVQIAGITYLVELPPRDGGTPRDKRFNFLIFEFEQEDPGVECEIQTNVDKAGWRTIATYDLAVPKAQPVFTDDFGSRLALRIVQRGIDGGVTWLISDSQPVEAGSWGNA